MRAHRSPEETPRPFAAGRRDLVWEMSARSRAWVDRARARRVRVTFLCRRCRRREVISALTSGSFSFIFNDELASSSFDPSGSDPSATGVPLAGHLVVFAGKLSSLGHKAARALVVRLGGATGDDVNTRTTLLVIGGETNDGASAVGDAKGHSKSQKLKRAEELNATRAEQIQV